MNKSDLIRALSERRNCSLREAEIVVDTIFKTISRSLVRGERIELRGFASFTVKNYGSYKGRNPKTGEQIDVKAKRLPLFKVGKELRSTVDGR